MDAIGKQVRKQEGIPFEQVEVLILLADSPGEAIRMRDLASLTLRSKSGMTRLIDRIVRDGLVQRQTCEADRRAIFVSLTDQGRELIERVKPPAVQIMIDRFTSHLSAEEARVITSTLTRILKANGVELEHGFHVDGKDTILHSADRVLERTR
jgi:DNA-binding MarR family transcriptional regulator